LKPQFDQKLVSSFYLWFENKLLDDKIAAYQTGVSNTYKYVDAFDIPNGYNAYQGKYRQLVAEYEVSAPNTGIFVNGSFIPEGQANVYTDYNNGRIILPVSSGQALNITSTSTIKEVNTYLSNDNPEQVLVESDFVIDGESSPKVYQSSSKLDEKIYFLPACFIFPSDSENKEFALGGEEETKSRVRVMVLAKNNFILDGILSLFRDSARECISLVDFEDFPYGGFFSLKNYPYKYSDLKLNSSEKFYIQKVAASRINRNSNSQQKDKKFLIGFLDFDLSTYRFPRQ
jgi:hypothetical protein